MNLVNVMQGTPEWLDLKTRYYSASEAPVMMGVSRFMRRDELLKLKSFGVEKEFDEFTKKLHEKGHNAEESIRPFVEKIIDAMLYRTVGTLEINGLHLLASFDGITMIEDIIFEHKLYNMELAEQVANNILQPEYYWQLEHQFLVSGARKAIFVVSDGTPQKMKHMFYEPVPGRAEQLISHWKQFDDDLKSFVPQPIHVKPEVPAIIELPTLIVEIDGQIKNTNLAIYKKSALDFIANINTDLQTDEDFAKAEKTIRFCGEAEKHLELVKAQALEKTADINALFRTIDEIKEQMRSKRLMLDKLVKTQKEVIRAQLVAAVNTELNNHIKAINQSLGSSYVDVVSNFVIVIKGKRTIDPMRSALNDELARCKIEANAKADKIRVNLKMLADNSDYRFLFNDVNLIIHKDTEDFKMLVVNRVEQHKKAEAERLEKERERIRKEEEAKAQEAARAEAERLEKERMRKEEEAKAQEAARVINQPDSSKPLIGSQLSQSKAPEQAPPSETGGGVVDADFFPHESDSVETTDVTILPSMSPARLINEIELSLIENGIGKKTAAYITRLILDGKIKHVYASR
jgi:predicted phage-related endonuclease